MTAAFWILYSLSLYHATLYILQHYRGFHQSLQQTARIVPYLMVWPPARSFQLFIFWSPYISNIFKWNFPLWNTHTPAYEKLLSIAALFVYWSDCNVVLHVSAHVQNHRQEKSSMATFFSNWAETCSTVRSIYENCCEWQFSLVLQLEAI
jgi:hypothetical protein